LILSPLDRALASYGYGFLRSGKGSLPAHRWLSSYSALPVSWIESASLSEMIIELLAIHQANGKQKGKQVGLLGQQLLACKQASVSTKNQ
jgi:hypothetical protein